MFIPTMYDNESLWLLSDAVMCDAALLSHDSVNAKAIDTKMVVNILCFKNILVVGLAIAAPSYIAKTAQFDALQERLRAYARV